MKNDGHCMTREVRFTRGTYLAAVWHATGVKSHGCSTGLSLNINNKNLFFIIIYLGPDMPLVKSSRASCGVWLCAVRML